MSRGRSGFAEVVEPLHRRLDREEPRQLRVPLLVVRCWADTRPVLRQDDDVDEALAIECCAENAHDGFAPDH